MKHIALSAALCAAVLFGASELRAQSQATTPRTITYQGALRLSNGLSAKDSTYAVTVRLYSDEAGTQEVWSGTYPTQTIGGVFNIALGSGEKPFPQAASMDRPLWLGIQVDGSPEMRPLSAMSASAFALNVPDKSISESKISADYVKSVTVNGQKVSGNGKELNIETGDGLLATVDEATNSIMLKGGVPSLTGVKGGDVQGNTTISGSLTVTGSTYLGGGPGSPVYINSLTTGSVPFIGASSVIAQDNSKFFWDNTGKRLGIGTNTPAKALDVRGSASLGTTTADSVAIKGRINSDLLPQADNTYDLGDASHYWNNAWIEHLNVGPHSLTMTNGDIETQMTMPTPDGAFQINVIDMSVPAAPVVFNPFSVDQFGMQTTDLQSDAITSGNSIKIDGTSNPRFIQSDADMKIFADPALDGGSNPNGALGKWISIYAGPGGAKGVLPDAGNGGDLVLASGKKGTGAVAAVDGTIYFKTGGITPGTTQMYIDQSGVTITNALFTTGTFSSSAITPSVYGGTTAGSNLGLFTTNSTSAPTGTITLGGSTGGGATTFATINATGMNLGSGIALKTNGTTRLTTSGDATFTTLTSNGAAAINNNNNANTQINTGSSTGTVDIGNFANGGNASLRSHGTITIQGVANVNTTASDGATSIGNSSNTLGLTASTITATGALNTHGATTINATGSDGATSIGNASNTVGITASTITATGALNTHGAATINATGSDGATTIGNASNTTDMHASASTVNTASGDGTTAIGYRTHALDMHGNATLNTGANDGTTDIGNAAKAASITATTTTITSALTTHGTALVNTTASDGATTIGNASNTLALIGSTVTTTGTVTNHGDFNINTVASDGNTSIGNSSNTLGLTASTITATGALNTHGVATINTTASDGNTSIGNASNTLGLTASTITSNGAIVANGTLTTHGVANINTTASDGNTSVGNASNTVDVTASTITATGALNTHGATTINTAASDGNTSIGNASNTVDVTASTITATGALNTHGATTINTAASDGNTSIGNASNTVGLTASTITATGALNTHGATTINTTSSDGNTSIGNASNTVGVTASTLTATATTANINTSGAGATNISTGTGNTVIGNSTGTVSITGSDTSWSIPSTGMPRYSHIVINNGGTDNAITIPSGVQYVVLNGCDTTTGNPHQVTVNAPTGQLGQTMYIVNANHWNGSNDAVYLVLGSNFAGYQVAGGFTIAPGYGNMFMWADDDGTGTAGWIYIGL